jgi:lipid-binding SYLF domain-containing protein
MKKVRNLLIVAFIFWVSTVAVSAQAESYSRTLQMFRNYPHLRYFFDNSYGYAVFPTIGKAGYVIGGSYGNGRVYRGGKVTGRSMMIEGSIGFQIGGEAFSEIIFFEDKRAYQEFTSGNFEFDATAQAVAVTVGAGAQAGTTGVSAGASGGPGSGVQADTGYFKGMAIFVHPKGGLMVEFSVGGQKFSFERR